MVETELHEAQRFLAVARCRLLESRMSRSLALGGALILCAVPSATMAMPLSEAAVRATVDRAAAQFIKMNPQSVGISVGVYVGGNTYTYNYGATTPGGKQKPTSKTLYPIPARSTAPTRLRAGARADGRTRACAPPSRPHRRSRCSVVVDQDAWRHQRRRTSVAQRAQSLVPLLPPVLFETAYAALPSAISPGSMAVLSRARLHDGGRLLAL